MSNSYGNTRLCFPEMPPESLDIVHCIRESRGITGVRQDDAFVSHRRGMPIRLRLQGRVVAEDDGQPMSDNIARLRESV